MKNNIIDLLIKVGAIIKDSHFVGTSGKHMPVYINKDALLPKTKYTSQVGVMMAEKFKNKKIEVVVAPAVAGIPLSQWTAYHLSRLIKKEVLAIFTEKTLENDQILKRGFDLAIKDKRVLVVEDIATTGSSVKKVIESVRKAGGKIVAVCVMVNRDSQLVNSKTIGVPFFSLATYKVPSYEPKDCPLCKKGVPINIQFGHGKKFIGLKV
ncbi:orotate phosphoribosyltransferase [Candidatus Azambacteria bacterium]|nr:orotate phosphoribosyltransferase [Candidatus Azambacteria bacterium]